MGLRFEVKGFGVQGFGQESPPWHQAREDHVRRLDIAVDDALRVYVNLRDPFQKKLSVLEALGIYTRKKGDLGCSSVGML